MFSRQGLESEFSDISGKHALYMVFDGNGSEEIADLHDMVFTGEGDKNNLTPAPTAAPAQSTPATADKYGEISP